MKRILCLLSMAALFSMGSYAYGQDTSERLDALESSLKNQTKTIEEQQKVINNLREEVEKQKNQEPQQRMQEESSLSKVSGFFGGSNLANPNISLLLNTYYYNSNFSNEELASRGVPGFTTQGIDRRNGFNLDSVELSIFAPVDPYFNLYTNIPITEDGLELEEAYVVTTSLPEGFQVKGGKFKSNFSRLDSQHPHAWDFQDIALPYRAFLGSEGLGGEKGIQLTYLPPLSVYTQFGAEVLQGDNDLIFGKDARSGPHAFSLFVKSSFDTTDDSTFYWGPSVLFGKTKNSNIVSAAEFDGNSALYGMEVVWKWKPSKSESLTLQGEYLFLAQRGNLTDITASSVDSLRRRQDGFYLQGIYQLDRWRFGARYDMLELFADNFKRAGTQQNFGATPWRVTGAVDFNPSEFTRIRLQYTHDRSGGDGKSNDEAMLQFIFGIGAHAAHTF